MKTLGITSLLVMIALSLLAPLAQANPLAFSCKGTLQLKDYQLDIYQGTYGDDVSITLTTTEGRAQTFNKAPATGFANGECGTRATPCQMILNALYSSDALNLIFTFGGPLDSKYSSGELYFYDNGFAAPQTEEIYMNCTKFAE